MQRFIERLRMACTVKPGKRPSRIVRHRPWPFKSLLIVSAKQAEVGEYFETAVR
jgi:hypothetical protein